MLRFSWLPFWCWNTPDYLLNKQISTSAFLLGIAFLTFETYLILEGYWRHDFWVFVFDCFSVEDLARLIPSHLFLSILVLLCWLLRRKFLHNATSFSHCWRHHIMNNVFKLVGIRRLHQMLSYLLSSSFLMVWIFTRVAVVVSNTYHDWDPLFLLCASSTLLGVDPWQGNLNRNLVFLMVHQLLLQGFTIDSA